MAPENLGPYKEKLTEVGKVRFIRFLFPKKSAPLDEASAQALRQQQESSQPQHVADSRPQSSFRSRRYRLEVEPPRLTPELVEQIARRIRIRREQGRPVLESFGIFGMVDSFRQLFFRKPPSWTACRLCPGSGRLRARRWARGKCPLRISGHICGCRTQGSSRVARVAFVVVAVAGARRASAGSLRRATSPGFRFRWWRAGMT